MHIYLIKDYARVDGVTGDFIEQQFAGDLEKHDREIVLHSGMNQYVSFQIIFQTDGEGIRSSDVILNNLQGPGGHPGGRSRIVYRMVSSNGWRLCSRLLNPDVIRLQVSSAAR